MLDSHCADLKAVQGGGAGWFFHIYSYVVSPVMVEVLTTLFV
jgi:hypothetical protein